MTNRSLSPRALGDANVTLKAVTILSHLHCVATHRHRRAECGDGQRVATWSGAPHGCEVTWLDRQDRVGSRHMSGAACSNCSMFQPSKTPVRFFGKITHLRSFFVDFSNKFSFEPLRFETNDPAPVSYSDDVYYPPTHPPHVRIGVVGVTTLRNPYFGLFFVAFQIRSRSQK